MKCKDCPFYWADYDDDDVDSEQTDFYCHYTYDDGCAPCEIDDKYETEDVDDE